jgi:uncharacterized lipoprotein
MATVAKVLFGLALGLQLGCSGTFINRPIVYEDSRETPPLEVPADLMRPAVNPALQIPAVAGVATNADLSPPTLGNTVAATRGGLPRAANAVLSIADEPASTWRRVGIALQRSGCCKMLSQDESTMVYQVELISDAPKPGFFSRMFGSSEPSTSMQVKVATAGSGSNVTIVDENGKVRVDDPAMTVLGVVEARLR